MLFLMSLIGCSQVIKTEYIEPYVPGLPARGEYMPVRWFMIEGHYCVNKEEAINLLWNREIDLLYQKELELIIRGLHERGASKNSK